MAVGITDYITEYTLNDKEDNIYKIIKLGKIGSEMSEKMNTHGSWICTKTKYNNVMYLVNPTSYDHDSEGIPDWVRSDIVEMQKIQKNTHAPEFVVFNTPHEAFVILKNKVQNLI